MLVYQDLDTTSSVIRDLFNSDVSKVFIDSKKLFKEIKNYVKLVQPAVSEKIELYKTSMGIFDDFNIEQQNYFNYIKKKVGLTWAEPGSLLQDDELEEPELQADSLGVKPKKKKGISGFLNKFKKKKDQNTDTNEEDQPPDNNN